MQIQSKRKHESKVCPRCKVSFECKVGSIVLCQCSTIKLSDAERDYLRKMFNDCLCVSCMKELKSEYHVQRFKNRLKKLMRLG